MEGGGLFLECPGGKALPFAKAVGVVELFWEAKGRWKARRPPVASAKGKENAPKGRTIALCRRGRAFALGLRELSWA